MPTCPATCPAAIKLFYWSRLAYQQEAAGTAHKYVNSATALPLFGLEHFETIWDDTTDMHCALGWNGSQVVVAFRWAAGRWLELRAWVRVGLDSWGRIGGRLQALWGTAASWVCRLPFDCTLTVRHPSACPLCPAGAPRRFRT